MVLFKICRKCRKDMIQMHKQELCKVHRYLFRCDQSGLRFCDQYIIEENRDSVMMLILMTIAAEIGQRETEIPKDNPDYR